MWPCLSTQCYSAAGAAAVAVCVCAPQKAGVPTVPGSEGLIADEKDAVKVAKEVGFPLMIKATAGGFWGVFGV
jgi:acetyl/propionyl-CoA carboxylase alpha subunit